MVDLKLICIIGQPDLTNSLIFADIYPMLNIGWSIRIYILMTGRNAEQTKDVRMYIEEFILVEIWIHCCTKLN